MLDEEITKIHQCVNEMDNALSEIDRYDPGTFIRIVTQIAQKEQIEFANTNRAD